MNGSAKIVKQISNVKNCWYRDENIQTNYCNFSEPYLGYSNALCRYPEYSLQEWRDS